MIWQNTGLMTAVAVLICGAAVYAFCILLRNRTSIQSNVTERGFWFVTLGLTLIGLFYIADLVIMFALPGYMPQAEVMAIVHWHHEELSWIVMPLAMALLAGGFATNILAVSEVIRQSRESEARYRAVAENAGDWIWETDSELRFSFVSPRFFELFPFTPEDMIGKTRREFSRVAGAHDVDSDAAWRQHLDDLDQHRPLRDLPITFSPGDGRTYHIVISGNPVFDDNGVFQGYRGSGSDRTAEFEARSALEKTRQRLRDLNEGALQGVLVHAGGELVMANNALAEMFGYACHMELVDQGVIDTLLVLGERERIANHEKALQNGRPAPDTLDCTCRRKNGTVFRARLRLRPVEWDGRAAMQIAMLELSGESAVEADAATVSAGRVHPAA